MQSYLQYRNLGRRIKNQLEQNRLKRRLPNSGEENSNLDPSISDDEDPETNDSPLSGTSSLEDLENVSPRLTLNSHVLDHIETHRTTGTQVGISLTGIDVRSRRTAEGRELGKVFVVGYDGNKDPMSPHNWPLRKRIFATANVGIIALVVGTAASIDSAAIPQAAAAFGVSEVVEALATGLVCLVRSNHSTSSALTRCLVSLRLWVRSPPRWPIVRNGWAKSSLYRLHLCLHDVHYGRRFIAKYWKSTCVSFPSWVLRRSAVVNRWGLAGGYVGSHAETHCVSFFCKYVMIYSFLI